MASSAPPGAALPSDAAEQVRKIRALEQEVLAAIDGIVGTRNASGSTLSVAERARDPATVGRTGRAWLATSSTRVMNGPCACY
jgi:hypothetical protein